MTNTTKPKPFSKQENTLLPTNLLPYSATSTPSYLRSYPHILSKLQLRQVMSNNLSAVLSRPTLLLPLLAPTIS